ncbi:g3812 [Coccomyxa elongata]
MDLRNSLWATQLPSTSYAHAGLRKRDAGSTRHVLCKAVASSSAAATTTATPATQALPELSAEVRRDTAVLEARNDNAPGSRVKAYVLGVSHVSRESCEEAAELIASVRPDVVVLELCKDRLRLLLDQENPGKRLWHTPRVKISGIPEGDAWPSPEQLISLLRTAPGRPVATQDIEADCSRLLETGLFARARPTTQLPMATQAPDFVRDIDGHLNPVIPLNQVEFTVTQRMLPKLASFSLRVDSSLGEGLSLPEETSARVCSEAMQLGESAATAEVCLRMLPKLEALAASHSHEQEVEVVYRGIESGNIEAVFKSATAESRARPYRTGLEGSAVGGEGPGIEPFRPNRGPLKLSTNLIIENLAKVLEVAPETIDTVADTAVVEEGATTGNQWRPWTAEEAQAAIDKENEEDEEDSWSEKFAMALTTAYAAQQSAAAAKCGVSPGEVWRAALEAASNVGTRQVHLGDLPANIMAPRLGDGVWRAALISLGLVVAAASAAVAGELTHRLPEGTEALAAGGVAAVAALAALPLVSPLVQIWLLAQKSKEEIEDIVRMKEPLQGNNLDAPVEIWGEDALLQWPGARRSLIQDRDAYMARTIWAAATGVPAAPAYIADNEAGMRVWRYVVPEGGPTAAGPPGYGDGEYRPAGDPQTVVAVVGSAHVRGIVREWERLKGQSDCLQRLNELLGDNEG